MRILSKSILATVFLTFILGFTNIYSQSESEEINALIEQKVKYNSTNKNSVVYIIQIYNGDEDESYKMRNNFNLTFPEYRSKVVYNKPEFKTQIGDFKTRLEADKVLLIIQEEFLGAFVLEDKI